MSEFTEGLDDTMPTIPPKGKRHRGHRWIREVNAKLNEHGELTEAPARAEAVHFEWPLDAGIPSDFTAGDLEVAGVSVANILTAPERLGEKDMVHLPAHYARFPIEPIRFICENKLDFFQGNVIKYICRHDAKNGVEDIDKVIRYATMYKKWLQKDPDWWR